MNLRPEFVVERECVIPINVPVVYMARDVMNFRGANPFRGSFEGVGPKNRNFFGPWNGNERNECHLALILSPVQCYIQNYLLCYV